MNSDKDGEKPSKEREAKTKAAKREPLEPETKPAQDPSESRETAEGGYGWGV